MLPRRRFGWGTEMQFLLTSGATTTGTSGHIPIPTPVIVNDVRLKVQKFFPLFKTGQHAAIDNIHIYECPKKITLRPVDPEGKLMITMAGADFF